MSTVRIQVRRGTASQWTSVNPILAAGEMGVESDTNLFKFGNGSSTWTALAYANNSDVAIGEISQDAINTALSMGAGLTKSYNDGTNTIQITVDSDVVALKSYVDSEITATEGYADSAVSTHNSDTTGVHGIANTADLATKNYVDSAVSGLQNTVDSDYVPVSDLGQPNGVATLNASSKVPTGQIDTTIIAEKSYVDSQAAAAILSAESYTNQSINNLVNGAPAALDTLKELSDSLAGDTDFAGSVTLALGTKAPKVDPTFTGTVVLPSSTSIGSVTDAEIGNLAGTTSSIQNQIDGHQSQLDDHQYDIDAKAPLASPTFTGNVTLPLGTNIGDVTSTEIAYIAGVTSGIQNQLDDKAPSNAPTFTGNVTLPSSTSIGDVTNLEIESLDGVTSNIQDQLDDKAPLAGPTFTGNVSLPSSTNIGTVTNLEIGYLGGVTSGIQDQIDDKAPINNAVFTGTFEAPVATITGAMIANGTIQSANIENGAIDTIDLADNSVTGDKIADATIVEGNLASGSVTSDKIAAGTIVDGDINASAGIDKTKIAGTAVTLTDTGTIATAMIADSAVTSDKIANGTIVDADINASAAIAQSKVDGLTSDLALKAPLANPTFTGTVSGVTKAHVGLSNVDDTSDANKPISTATQTALDAKASLSGAIFTGSVEIDQNLTVDGNLTVTGTTTTVNTTNFTTADPLIYLGEGNNANLVDLGFVGSYNDGTYAHQGLAKDSSDGKWKLFKGVTDEPTTTINFSQGSLDALKVGAFEATTVTPSAGIVFSDKTQTKAGVPSRTPIATAVSASTTLASGLQDSMVPLTGAVTITIGDASNANYAIGESVDFYQASGTGAQFAKTGSVNLLYTPGALLRTTYSSATAQKVSSTDWLIYGDLKA